MSMTIKECVAKKNEIEGAISELDTIKEQVNPKNIMLLNKIYSLKYELLNEYYQLSQPKDKKPLNKSVKTTGKS